MSWSTLGGQIQRLLADMARFIVTPNEASVLGLGKREGLEKHIRAYRNGRDLTHIPAASWSLICSALTPMRCGAGSPRSGEVHHCPPQAILTLA
jgi:hypothetical protein